MSSNLVLPSFSSLPNSFSGIYTHSLCFPSSHSLEPTPVRLHPHPSLFFWRSSMNSKLLTSMVHLSTSSPLTSTTWHNRSLLSSLPWKIFSPESHDNTFSFNLITLWMFHQHLKLTTSETELTSYASPAPTPPCPFPPTTLPHSGNGSCPLPAAQAGKLWLGLSFSHTLHSVHQQIIFAGASQSIQTLTTSHQLSGYCFDLSYRHVIPGMSQQSLLSLLCFCPSLRPFLRQQPQFSWWKWSPPLITACKAEALIIRAATISVALPLVTLPFSQETPDSLAPSYPLI